MVLAVTGTPAMDCDSEMCCGMGKMREATGNRDNQSVLQTGSNDGSQSKKNDKPVIPFDVGSQVSMGMVWPLPFKISRNSYVVVSYQALKQINSA